jgi:hypothetical protein
MDIVALSLGVFGVASLAAAFIRTTRSKRKFARSWDHDKNQLRRF